MIGWKVWCHGFRPISGQASASTLDRGVTGAAAKTDDQIMARCEGYYRLENRRCDRPGKREALCEDGARYVVCDYHARELTVARWHGESDRRSSPPTGARTVGAAAFAAG